MTLVDEAPAVTATLATEPVTMPGAVKFDLASKIAGRTYRIFVYQPMIPAPPEGYPVITVTDGNMNFLLAAVMAGMFAFQAKPAMVVGVGYPTDAPFDMMRLRVRDLTPETPMENIRISPGLPEPTPENYGGAELFRRFLVEELRPLIAARWSVNPDEQTLYGYSLGGLFTLNALFDDPGAFNGYVAASPSIWWNGRAALDKEAAFARRVEAGEVAPRVLVTVGEYEQDPPKVPPPGMSPEEIRDLVTEARMVENALELGARLAHLKGADGYDARFHCFEAEDHLSAMAASIGRAVDFALRP
jgi:predicted alpha/beta superfamily hydrolase